MPTFGKFHNLLLLAVLVTAGCASNPQGTFATARAESTNAEETHTLAATNSSKADKNGDRMVCRVEKRTGSHRSHKVCRYADDIRTDSARSQRELDRNSRIGSASGSN
ncbi:MAG: hypothetical protein V3T39_00860 [Gammaproteobacteria bacterium]